MIKTPGNPFKAAFYAFIRRRMTPIDVEEAQQKKLFWAKIYLASAVALNVYILSRLHTYEHSEERDPREILSRVTMYNEDKPVRVIKYSGFSKVADYRLKDGQIVDDVTKGNPSSEPSVS